MNEVGRHKPRAGDAVGTGPALALSVNRWPIPGSEVTGELALLPLGFLLSPFRHLIPRV